MVLFLGLFASCRVSKNENQRKDKAVSVVETEKGLFITINGVPFNMIKVDGSTKTLGTTLEQEGSALEYMNEPDRVTIPNVCIGET